MFWTNAAGHVFAGDCTKDVIWASTVHGGWARFRYTLSMQQIAQQGRSSWVSRVATTMGLLPATLLVTIVCGCACDGERTSSQTPVPASPAANTPAPTPLSAEQRLFPETDTSPLSVELARHVPADTTLLVTVPRFELAYRVIAMMTTQARERSTAQLRAWTGIDLLDAEAARAAGIRLDAPAGLGLLDAAGGFAVDRVIVLLTVADESVFRAALGTHAVSMTGNVAAVPLTGDRDALATLQAVEQSTSLAARPEFARAAQKLRFGRHVGMYSVPSTWLREAHEEHTTELRALSKRPAEQQLATYRDKLARRNKAKLGKRDQRKLATLENEARDEADSIRRLERLQRRYQALIEPIQGVAAGLTVDDDKVSMVLTGALSERRGRWAEATDAQPLQRSPHGTPHFSISTSLGHELVDWVISAQSLHSPFKPLKAALTSLGVDFNDDVIASGSGGVSVNINDTGRAISMTLGLADGIALGDTIRAARAASSQNSDPATAATPATPTHDSWMVFDRDRMRIERDALVFRTQDNGSLGDSEAPLTRVQDPRLQEVLQIDGAIRIAMDGRLHGTHTAFEMATRAGMLGLLSDNVGFLSLMGRPTKKTARVRKQLEEAREQHRALKRTVEASRSSARADVFAAIGSTVGVVRVEGDVIRGFAVHVSAADIPHTARALAAWWYTRADVHPANVELAEARTNVDRLSSALNKTYKYEDLFSSHLEADSIGMGAFGTGANGLSRSRRWDYGGGSGGMLGTSGGGGGSSVGVRGSIGGIGRGGRRGQATTGSARTGGRARIGSNDGDSGEDDDKGRGEPVSGTAKIALDRVTDGRLRTYGSNKVRNVRFCYTKADGVSQAWTGTVSVALQVNENGVVDRADVTGTGDAGFHRCISAALRGRIQPVPGKSIQAVIAYSLAID